MWRVGEVLSPATHATIAKACVICALGSAHLKVCIVLSSERGYELEGKI